MKKCPGSLPTPRSGEEVAVARWINGGAASVQAVEQRRPPRFGPGTVLLFLVGMAGIYFFARGIGDFLHGGSHTAGTVFVLLGLVCYVGGGAVGRWARRRG